MKKPRKEKKLPREVKRHKQRPQQAQRRDRLCRNNNKNAAADAAADAVDTAAGADNDNETKAAQTLDTAAGGAPGVAKAAAKVAKIDENAIARGPTQTNAEGRDATAIAGVMVTAVLLVHDVGAKLMLSVV